MHPNMPNMAKCKTKNGLQNWVYGSIMLKFFEIFETTKKILSRLKWCQPLVIEPVTMAPAAFYKYIFWDTLYTSFFDFFLKISSENAFLWLIFWSSIQEVSHRPIPRNVIWIKCKQKYFYINILLRQDVPSNQSGFCIYLLDQGGQVGQGGEEARIMK